MAVTYVSEFSFPADFGFHKNGSASVPGKAKGGRASTPMRYARGGQIKPEGGKPVSGTSPDVAKGVAGDRKFMPKQSALSDHKFPGTRTEKSSGMQKPAFAKGGHATTPYAYKDGGHAKGCSCKACGGMMKKAEGGEIKTAAGKVGMGRKPAWNRDDATSPGSYKRTPPGEGMRNSKAAKSNFDGEGRNEDAPTQQKGDVERMSGYSDFKRGGKVHKKAGGGQIKTEDRYETGDHGQKISAPERAESGDGMAYKSGGRIKNLGHYAHGGKVGAKYEKAAGTPKMSHDGSKSEHPSGKATGKHTATQQGTKKTNGKAPLHEKHLAQGGLSRGVNPKRNAAIHAKNRKAHSGPSPGALAGLLGGMAPPSQPPSPGIGPTPPGMAPGMGSPPGGPMGGMAPPPGPGAPAMASGGSTKHVFHHHLSYKA